jgi:hypothetical protein
MRPPRLQRYICSFASLLTLLSLLACGQRRMVRTTHQIRSQLRAGNYEAALAALRKGKREAFREQDRVVYWMNEGMLLHLLGRLDESNKVLEAAEKRSEELFTRSIRKDVKAAFTSQAATDYQGEDYEKVLLNVVKALNYAGIGDLESALVEARRINAKLRYYNTKYERKNVYNQDAFAHWLAGMLFEVERSYDDARISFEKALKVYLDDFTPNYGIEPPSYLIEDIIRTARLGGDEERAARYGEKYQVEGKTAELLKSRGEIVLIHFTGEGPTKSDFFITCWFRGVNYWRCDGEPSGEFINRVRIDVPSDGTVVKVAFPRLHLHPPANPYAMVGAGASRTRTQPAYPLNAIAGKTLRDKTHRIFRNAVIRAITKAAAQTAAGAAGKKAGGGFGQWLAKTTSSVAMQAAEEADKRAWTTLPARIDVARLMVNPGVHDLEIQLPNGRRTTIPQLEVEAGERVFVTHRTLP